MTRSFPSQDEGLWKLGAHWGDGRAEFLVFAPFPHKMAVKNFNSRAVEVTFPSRKEAWKKAVDTSEERWMGPGSSAPSDIETSEKFDIEALSFILYLGI